MGAWLAAAALKLTPVAKIALGWLWRILTFQFRVRVWMIVAALLFGLHWHNKSIDANNAAWNAKIQAIAAKALAIKEKADALNRAIADRLRSKTDEENRRIAARADDLRVSGPGKAICPGLPARPGGREQASGSGNAAGPQMPPADSAAVPWDWLVERAEQADLNRAEVLSWREWYAQMVKAWPN